MYHLRMSRERVREIATRIGRLLPIAWMRAHFAPAKPTLSSAPRETPLASPQTTSTLEIPDTGGLPSDVIIQAMFNGQIPIATYRGIRTDHGTIQISEVPLKK